MKSANASISSRLVHGMRSLRSGTRASLSVVRNFGATVARAASARWFLPAALAVMLIFHGLSNWHIITRNTEMILNDPTSYFSFMVKFLSNIQERNWHTVFFEQLPHVWKPPLYFVVSAPLLLIDHSIHAAVMSNIFFLGMTMLLIYVIGQKIFNSATGALSAFLFSMIPTVFALSRVFYIETALTTMVTLTFFLFISGRFRSVPVAVGTGLVMALGMLTKQPYPVYILPFFLYLVFADGQPSGVRWRNVLLAAGIALTIAAYWYAQDGRLSFDYYNRYVSERISLDRLFYLKSLSMRQLFPVFFIIVALSFFHAVRRRQYFIPAYVIFLTLVFSFSDNRQDRYLLPLFPFIALSAGNYLVSVTRRRATICALAVIFCFVQYAVISYYPQQLFRIVPYLEQYFPYNRDDNWGMYAISPRQNDWQGEKSIPAPAL